MKNVPQMIFAKIVTEVTKGSFCDGAVEAKRPVSDAGSGTLSDEKTLERSFILLVGPWNPGGCASLNGRRRWESPRIKIRRARVGVQLPGPEALIGSAADLRHDQGTGQ